MDNSLSQQIEDLRNQARADGTSKTATIMIKGHPCTVTAAPVGIWAYQGTNIKIEYKTLNGRACTMDFIYNKGQGVAQELQSLTEQIDSIDQDFIAIPQGPKGKVLPIIFSKIVGCTQPMPIGNMSSHAPRICTFLHGVENFVQQNDLTTDEITNLKSMLWTLCGAPIIKCSNGYFSINECDHNSHYRAIALRVESLEILLDAKACGQVRLERNIPPPLRDLGIGAFNTVQLAHRKPGVGMGEASDPIVLKPCDQSKSEIDLDTFTWDAGTVQECVGTASGSYRRNRATSMVQDMLCEIGQTNGIEVPHVIATVSAAEASIEGKRTPCIAMEMLDGKTVRSAVSEGELRYDNEFIRRGTWIQIQDILTGQIDRHRGNVMLTVDGPVAFDHDLSFPTKPHGTLLIAFLT
ncbi:MAG: hypothetical protein LBE98_01605 [Puniceicoccales bacterium]|jgi:hypothetical protein|nr:hypothetical protein [Puniceicoccales bacterium]